MLATGRWGACAKHRRARHSFVSRIRCREEHDLQTRMASAHKPTRAHEREEARRQRHRLPAAEVQRIFALGPMSAMNDGDVLQDDPDIDEEQDLPGMRF